MPLLTGLVISKMFVGITRKQTYDERVLKANVCVCVGVFIAFLLAMALGQLPWTSSNIAIGKYDKETVAELYLNRGYSYKNYIKHSLTFLFMCDSFHI